ncbi:unnamed protein product [Gulo gulo]|uniref:Uncharacterized protein n=1 Tax=Gulo gulo TaxID=48420 RepID=A0A9X9LIQ5_GULGU|nr:unnamed protein product [Gulo gulo]
MKHSSSILVFVFTGEGGYQSHALCLVPAIVQPRCRLG